MQLNAKYRVTWQHPLCVCVCICSRAFDWLYQCMRVPSPTMSLLPSFRELQSKFSFHQRNGWTLFQFYQLHNITTLCDSRVREEKCAQLPRTSVWFASIWPFWLKQNYWQCSFSFVFCLYVHYHKQQNVDSQNNSKNIYYFPALQHHWFHVSANKWVKRWKLPKRIRVGEMGAELVHICRLAQTTQINSKSPVSLLAPASWSHVETASVGKWFWHRD